MTIERQRLYINIDHIATVRQARRGDEPVPVQAVPVCERAGADGITAHLREDRRHIQDADIDAIATSVTTVFNLEMACTEEMLRLAERLRPHQVTLVPERREEVTTEGGLALAGASERLRDALQRLRAAGIRASLFIDPDADSVTRSHGLGADAVELHTGQYAHAPNDPRTVAALRNSARLGHSLGLAVHAGHGLTTANVGPVAAIPEIEELNIGHHVISRAIFVGLDAAVRELRAAMDAARGTA
ncbi:MAG: pdxJ [Gemmatimonadetes bacterium]|jgi:pyridoxine 5-phosphate synthase|nr:pdxJ [Gemmatimonadota bacterium]